MPEDAGIREEWLEGLTDAERVERRELLRRLLAQGFSAQEIARAVAEDRIVLLEVERALGATLTAEEVARCSGLAAGRLTRARRLMGLPEPEPDERVFSEDEVQAARALKLFLDAGFSEASSDETTAVLGEGMARLAATIESQFAATFLRAGESEREAGERLALIARDLARLAAIVVHPPVRLIKTIGDAAMFVSPEPAALVALALDLLERAAAEDLPTLRAGIAFGPAVQRAGDFYGNSVNLASRVTGVARPGSVLCTAEIHEACASQFDWSFTGRHRLKGVSRPAPLHRARRVATS